MTINIRTSRTFLALAFLLALLIPRASAASDGVIEINQARALHGGVTSGDAAGFPVTITESGSYRLTGDLLLPVNTFGIQITTSNVSVDLGGHSIQGPVSCSGTGSAIVCGPSSFGNGIDAFSTDPLRNIIIRNGTVSGMGSSGVILLGVTNAIVEDVTVAQTRLTGILTSESAIVHRCIARNNGGVGIGTSSGVLSENLSHGNGSSGFTGVAVVARDNVATENGQHGISVSAGSLMLRNVLSFNEGLGISASNGPSGYGQNHIRADTAVPGSGTVSGALVELGTNFCEGATPQTTCP